MDELRQEREEEQSPKPLSAAETEPEEKRDDDEEGVEWDGSEAELVLDDDAADYEEPQTGIKLSYTLPRKGSVPRAGEVRLFQDAGQARSRGGRDPRAAGGVFLRDLCAHGAGR